MTWGEGAVAAVRPLEDSAVRRIELGPAPGAPAGGVAGAGFGELVGQGIAEVNQELMVAQTDLQRLATGDVQNLHQVMIRLEESLLSFQLMLQIRNRLLEVYQNITTMQV